MNPIFNLTSQEIKAFTDQYKSLLPKTHPPKNGLSGNEAKNFFMLSKIPPPELGKIWQLVDITNDGILNFGEFCAAMKLIRLKVQFNSTNGMNGSNIPDTLPNTLLMFIKNNQNLDSSLSGLSSLSDVSSLSTNPSSQIIQRTQTGMPMTTTAPIRPSHTGVLVARVFEVLFFFYMGENLACRT